MDAIAAIRLFNVEAPVASAVTGGVVFELAGTDWRHYPDRPDEHTEAFDRYRCEHLADLGGSRPAPQAVYGSVVVVLDELLVDVLEDGVEFRFRVDVPDARAVCTERTDESTGVVAERTVSDGRLADGLQRSADAVDHAIGWASVISPRSFDDVVDAAEDLTGDDGGGEP